LLPRRRPPRLGDRPGRPGRPGLHRRRPVHRAARGRHARRRRRPARVPTAPARVFRPPRLPGLTLTTSRTRMKITDVRTIPLRGATHDTGWPGGTDPAEQMNTLVEVHTDEGLVGIGS